MIFFGGKKALLCIVAALWLVAIASVADRPGAQLLERVIAIVNDNVVLLSEFETEMMKARKAQSGEDEEAVLERMIDRLLILEQARKIEAGSSNIVQSDEDIDRIINNYLQKRIKVLIHIPFDLMETYYLKNIFSYGGKDFPEVKDEIEQYLLEIEFRKKIKEHVAELREKAFVRIQLR